MYAADGACRRGRRRKKTPIAAMAITATPPTAPPIIAPIFELLLLEGEDVGEEDDDDRDVVDGDKGAGVVTAGKFVGFEDALVVVPVPPVPVLVMFEPLINAPGPISGVSPMSIALMESQRERSSRVTSARAHCGTCVPCGTGFGKVPGAATVEQLVAH